MGLREMLMRVSCVQGSRHEDAPRAADAADGSALDLRLNEPTHLQELTARLELRSNLHAANPQPTGDSETLRKVQQDKSNNRNALSLFEC